MDERVRIDDECRNTLATLASNPPPPFPSTSPQSVKEWVRTWCKKIEPEYLMASTPKNFTYTAVDLTQPGAFATSTSGKKRSITSDLDCCDEDTNQARYELLVAHLLAVNSIVIVATRLR